MRSRECSPFLVLRYTNYVLCWAIISVNSEINTSTCYIYSLNWHINNQQSIHNDADNDNDDDLPTAMYISIQNIMQ